MTDYKTTLNLPKTDFSMRAGLARKEPELLSAWDKRDLYGEIAKARADGPRFVMHDGPPYANGHLHHGHILNKILKDIVVKDRTMRGFRTGFIPGWDCHGLPIEVQVDKKLGKKKRDMSKAEIRGACRAYAEEYVGIQRDQFRRLGVLARWQEPYLTMNYQYEATILRELGKFAASGLLYKGLRPVNWCTVHQTALAEAEVQYDDHRSPSVYVAFQLCQSPPNFDGQADLVIWTTTPWTLPANLAVCLHPRLQYVAYPLKGRTRIVARELLESFLAACGDDDERELDEKKIQGRWQGSELEGLRYRHVFNDKECKVLLGQHVTLEAGTGCVHTAPGHGRDDFEVGRREGLPILSPVDDRGVFTDEAGAFAGKPVFEANAEIAHALHEQGALLNAEGETITHRYAHCWRCHRPIIMRATEQWFVAIDKPFADGPSLRKRALDALSEVVWIPSWGEDRIRGMLEARPDWCLSRQRIWGVPIAVVYCQQCGKPMVDQEKMNRVADIFQQKGADAWFKESVGDLFGDIKCQDCGGASFRKEEDILDVWFDSGISFAAVIESHDEGQESGPPVDLYLEGSDQHRGWFHSSLLCSLVTRQRPPYRQVLTHGFVVDGQGKKISKSKGNFLDPFKTIGQSGAELFRLWVADEDYREDIRISQEILNRLSDTYRKLRNTMRYLLGNLHGFDPERDWVDADKMLPLDRYALSLLKHAREKIDADYQAYEFHGVVHTLVEMCTVDLSAFYFDVLKDRLYTSGQDSALRRSAQTVLYVIARDLLRLMAPIFSFTAEEAWGYLPKLGGDPSSIHLARHPGLAEPELMVKLWADLEGCSDDDSYTQARQVRRAANLVLEQARQSKKIGSSTEAMLKIVASGDMLALLRKLGQAELADLCIVSRVSLVEGDGELHITVEKAPGTKCERCWLYREEVGSLAEHPTLCKRCVEAL